MEWILYPAAVAVGFGIGWFFCARRALNRTRRSAAEYVARVGELESALLEARRKLESAEAERNRATVRLRAEREKARRGEAAGPLAEEIEKRNERIRELESAYAVRDADVDSLLAAHEEQKARIAELEEELGRREETFGDLRTRLNEARERIRAFEKGDGPAAVADDLRRIRGIGEVLNRRFEEAGIRTFRQLAETPPEELLEVAKLPAWSVVDPEAWIAQAREFAGAARTPQ
jgi:predicted flap endonuclease-1-like 5' DNA nuclease